MHVDRRVGLIIGGVIALSIFLWVVFSIRGLINKGGTVYIYNPLETKLSIDIGNEHYELFPSELKKIELSEGQLNVKSKQENDVIMDTSILISHNFLKKGGLINLSGEPMYEWFEYYGAPGIESIYSIPNDTTGTVQSPLEQSRQQSSDFFKIDSTWLYGVVKEYSKDELVLVESWDFNIKQDFEEEISSGGDTYVGLGTTASKLFDKSGMLEYWFKNYPAIDLPKN